MSNALAVDLLTLGAQAASSSGAAVDIAAIRSALDLEVRVDAVSGTDPTLDVVIETSGSESGPWRSANGTLTQITDAAASGPGVYKFYVADCARYNRVTWTIGGTATPTFTFGVSGYAHTVYATVADLSRFGMSTNVMSDLDGQLVNEHVIAATGEASDYLSTAFELPLTSWGKSLTKRTATLAVYNIATGPNREAIDETLRDNYTDAIKWFNTIAAGRLRPTTILDSTPTVEEDSAYVVSDATRGW